MERKRMRIDDAPMEEDETRTDQNVNDVFLNSLTMPKDVLAERSRCNEPSNKDMSKVTVVRSNLPQGNLEEPARGKKRPVESQEGSAGDSHPPGQKKSTVGRPRGGDATRKRVRYVESQNEEGSGDEKDDDDAMPSEVESQVSDSSDEEIQVLELSDSSGDKIINVSVSCECCDSLETVGRPRGGVAPRERVRYGQSQNGRDEEIEVLEISDSSDESEDAQSEEPIMNSPSEAPKEPQSSNVTIEQSKSQDEEIIYIGGFNVRVDEEIALVALSESSEESEDAQSEEPKENSHSKMPEDGQRSKVGVEQSKSQKLEEPGGRNRRTVERQGGSPGDSHPSGQKKSTVDRTTLSSLCVTASTSANATKRMKMDNTSKEDNVNAVFQKKLVLDDILKFLPSSDVKALSEVNRDFLRAMDVRFLLGRLSGVLSSPAVVKNLKHLKRLDILECDYFNPGTFRGSHGPMYKVPVHPDISRDEDDNVTEDEERRCVPFAHNLRQLSVIPMRLESFKMAKVAICYGPEAQAMYLQHLLTIVTNSRKTLKDLSLHRAAWSSLELRELKMPALKRLTVTVERTNCLLPQVQETETLAAFLRNHPTLEELDVEAEEKICDILMPAIQDCRQLKKLHIKTRKFSWYVNWTFLGSLVHLKDFAIVRPEPPQPPRWRGHPEQSLVSYGTGRSFLASLPKNQLESLTLKGLSKMNPLSDMQDETSVGFWNTGRVETGLKMKIQLLKGFTCLRRLSLINCLDSLDNQLMQFILKEFVLLEELEVSHCYNLSDAGITGTGDTSVKGKANVSIANLRRLTSLIIRECPLVTPEGLASCLSLPSLKSLDYMTSAPILQWFLLAIAKQNPSLESLAVNYGGKWSLSLVKKHLKANSRLKRVGYPIEDYADLDSEPDGD